MLSTWDVCIMVKSAYVMTKIESTRSNHMKMLCKKWALKKSSLQTIHEEEELHIRIQATEPLIQRDVEPCKISYWWRCISFEWCFAYEDCLVGFYPNLQ